MKLGNHPTMINACYRIIDSIHTATRNFNSAQGLLKNLSRRSAVTEQVADAQIDEAIKQLKDAAKKLEALKSNYKNYIND